MNWKAYALNGTTSNEGKSWSLIEACPVLEIIIKRWDDVPREEKRDLFIEGKSLRQTVQAFGHNVNTLQIPLQMSEQGTHTGLRLHCNGIRKIMTPWE